jgi:maleate isomerase
MIYPAGGRSEKEFERIAPRSVNVHITRISWKKNTIAQLKGMARNLGEAADLLSQAGVDLILFNCTLGSLINGVGYDQKLIRRIEAKTGIQAMTTATAVLLAARHLGIGKISLVTAYGNKATSIERKFLKDNGFQVVKSSGAGITDPFEQAIREPSFWYDFSIKNFDRSAECLFISCAGIRVVEAIQKLEMSLGVPVLTSNQSAMWACLDKMHIKPNIKGYGLLLSGQI